LRGSFAVFFLLLLLLLLRLMGNPASGEDVVCCV